MKNEGFLEDLLESAVAFELCGGPVLLSSICGVKGFLDFQFFLVNRLCGYINYNIGPPEKNVKMFLLPHLLAIRRHSNT